MNAATAIDFGGESLRHRCDRIVCELSEIYSWREFAYAVQDLRGLRIQGSRPQSAHDTAEPVGCTAKAYTGFFAVDIFRRHGISLDCPIVQILPEFAVASESATETITMRHLLSHASGMDTEGLTGFPNEITHFWQRLRRIDQLFAPGQAQSYCSVGFSVAACAIERVAGQPWELIFDEWQRGCATEWCTRLSVREQYDSQVCEIASMGRELLVPLSQVATFGVECLAPNVEEFRQTALWSDGSCGFCACGTVDEINTRLQIVPQLGLAIAARVQGPEMDSVAVHDFFRKLLGSEWNGLIKPTSGIDHNRWLNLIGGRFACAFLDVRLSVRGNRVAADAWIGVEGEKTWIGDSRKHEVLALQMTTSGAILGDITVGPDPFPIMLEPLIRNGEVDYLIFNRKMLLRRIAAR